MKLSFCNVEELCMLNMTSAHISASEDAAAGRHIQVTDRTPGSREAGLS